MLKSLNIGNLNFPINLIQGPLAGYSSAAFRYLMTQYSTPAFTCTEMISAKSLLYQPKKLYERYLKRHSKEGPVCYQLSASDPDDLEHAAKVITDIGADLIDLNCGCPVKKIRSKGAGSQLLTKPELLYQLIHRLKRSTHLPITVKIRVEGDSDEKFNQRLAQVISEAGADALIVHGRHWTERYDQPCRFDQIKFFVENMSIPVIGNGDVSCISSLKTMLGTGCAGVMISRAGVGQPWLIKKLVNEAGEREFKHPSTMQIGTIFQQHLSELQELNNNEKFTIEQARKFSKYYARPLPNKIAFINEINQLQSVSAVSQVIHRYFVENEEIIKI